MARRLPDKPSLAGLEAKWSARWEEGQAYRFDRSADRGRVYSIDTPPPTVSGSLHIGHVYSYTHTDLAARFQRMRGKAVFYPIGWDDNGLPTERRVENVFGVRCDPTLAEPATATDLASTRAQPAKDAPRRAVSRPEFVRLCELLAAEDEAAFEALWRRVGLSVDWSTTYTTVGARAQRASQRSFLRLLARGQAYSAEAPTLWDVDFQTPVSQAELEDRDIDGAWYRIAFEKVGPLPPSGPIWVETTRPELLAACVALVANSEDPRYQPLFGQTVRTPLFEVEVPVLSHPLAEAGKGSGIAMVCTFGDVNDVTWWRELGLPLRAIVGRDGRLGSVAFGQPGWETRAPQAAQAAYDQLAGRPAPAARREVATLLAQAGALDGEPRPMRHAVKFYEKGSRPLEVVTSRQWFIKALDHRQALLARGRELSWHPSFMGVRFQGWVEGLTSDWNCSRQRHFGVPFPVWYPLGADGQADHGHPILATEDELPIDPSLHVPAGYAAEQRGVAGGFTAETDVMDTWATSSLSPQIVGGWEDDPGLFAQVFPFDLRPQAHDIIRTWLFYTVLRSHLEHGALPWSDAAISGFIVDPDRKKLSKSKGNVVLPTDLLDRFGSDAVRYWAASGRLGQDTVADENTMKDGRRLAIKLLNATRFVLSLSEDDVALRDVAGDEGLAPLDLALLARLAAVVEEATAAMEGYEATRALERVETFFWSFCDYYLELVKARAYAGDRSARATLQAALSTLLRLFAPVLAFATEEAWSWWQEGSVHHAAWPDGQALLPGGARSSDEGGPVLAAAAEVLGSIRRAKTEAQRSMRALVRRVLVVGSAERLAALRLAQGDLRQAGVVSTLELVEGPEGSVTVDLEPDAAA